MSAYIHLDEAIATPPTGYNNTGCICYWLALMQCILSCTPIKAKLINRKKTAGLGTPEEELLELFEPRNEQLKYFQPAAVLQAMLKAMQAKGLRFMFGAGQESTSEGLVHLIDVLPKEVESLIMHRQLRYAVCGNCGKSGTKTKEESIHFELFDESINAVNTAEEFASYLMTRKIPLADYKCEYCGHKHPATYQLEQLTMVPEILVVLFNKYADSIIPGRNYTATLRSQTIYCPAEFKLPAIDGGVRRYVQVGQARHVGGLNGGHYWAIIRRNGQYYMANDMSVAPTALDQSNLTYIVFYCLAA